MAVSVVLSAGIAEKRPVVGAIFGAGVWHWVPALFLRELAPIRQRLKQMLADVLHATRLCFFRVRELVNPDRLRHVAPPCSGSTVACVQRSKHLPGGTDVPGLQLGASDWTRLTYG